MKNSRISRPRCRSRQDKMAVVVCYTPDVAGKKYIVAVNILIGVDSLNDAAPKEDPNS